MYLLYKMDALNPIKVTFIKVFHVTLSREILKAQ